MLASIATLPGCPSRANEDWATATERVVVVLDGATARVETGCRHGIAWYAEKLGHAIVRESEDERQPLMDSLALAISDVAGQHPECDLSNPGTPSAAVAILRHRGEWIDTLVLADVTIAMEKRGGFVACVTDERVRTVAPIQRAAAYSLAYRDPRRTVALRELKKIQNARRNRAGGFFVAAADPAVAREALVDTIPAAQVMRVVLATDGAARIAAVFALMTWPEILSEADQAEGPAAILARVRSAEALDPDLTRWPRAKPSDDATIAYIAF